MSTRMQQRRGTSSQWTSANSVLAAGEIGFETNTGKFKIGDGTSTWSSLYYFADSSDFDTTIIEGKISTAVSNAVNSLLDGAPSALNTLNELAVAINNDSSFSSTIVQSLSTKASSASVTQAILSVRTDLDSAIAGVSQSIVTAIDSEVDNRNSAIGTHNTKTTNVHGIPDTSVLTTSSQLSSSVSSAVSTHNSATTSVHGISDTAALATKTYADGKASDAQTAAITAAATAADTKVSTHNSATTNVHGIADTSALATKTYADAIGTTATNALALKAPLASPTFTGTVSGITKSMVGLGNVDNTTDAGKPVSTATQTALDAKLALAGGTMTGALTLSGAPTSDLHAATKLYVDGLAAGINFHQAVKATTTVNLSTVYNNGTNGLGATLTADTNRAMTTIDGISIVVGDRVLVKDQTNATQNGIYTLTTLGSGSTPYVLTRATDTDNNPSGELATGDFCFVTSGTVNGSKGFLVSTTGTITIGTTNINYTQFNASEALTAGTNITKTGSTIAVADAPTFSGVITASSGVTFSDGTQTKEGVPSRTPIVAKTASYTLSALTERDSVIEVNSASAVTVTVPLNATIAYPVGTSIDILQTGAGQITVAGAAGVTVNATPGLKLRTQWSGATLFKRATDTWVLYGDLSA
jgi:hypothetical protein